MSGLVVDDVAVELDLLQLPVGRRRPGEVHRRMNSSTVPLFWIVILTCLSLNSFFVIVKLHWLPTAAAVGQVCGFDGELCTDGTVTPPKPLAPKTELLTVTL